MSSGEDDDGVGAHRQVTVAGVERGYREMREQRGRRSSRDRAATKPIRGGSGEVEARGLNGSRPRRQRSMRSMVGIAGPPTASLDGEARLTAVDGGPPGQASRSSGCRWPRARSTVSAATTAASAEPFPEERARKRTEEERERSG